MFVMKKRNLLLSVKNSIGSQVWRSYLDKNGVDILKDGDLSCAYYFSSILLMHGLIDRVHYRVDGTLQALEKAGWVEISKVREGCLVVWDAVHENGEHHMHVGFYIGDGQAISNRSSLGMPGEHPLHYTGLDKDGVKKKAPIIFIYWHPALD